MTQKTILIAAALGCLALVAVGCGDGMEHSASENGAETHPAATPIDPLVTPPVDDAATSGAITPTPADPESGDEIAPPGAENDEPATEPDEATAPFAEADLSEIMNEAIVYTTNVEGDPYTSGSVFSVDVALASPHEDPPMSFAFRVYYHGDYAKLEGMEQVESGLPRPTFGPVHGAGAETWNLFMSPGNMGNTKKNLTLCRMNFRVVATSDEPYSVRVVEDSSNVALPSVAMEPLFHEYVNAATDPLPRPDEEGDF